jgi:hypothetical protein
MMVTGRWLAALAFNWSDSILLPSLGLIIVLLAGAAVIVLIRRWRGQDDAPSVSPTEQLAEYRSLYDQGVMSKEEYDRLRAMLEGKTRAEMKLSAAPAPSRQTKSAEGPPAAANPAPAPPGSGSPPNPPAPEVGNGQP